MTNQAIQVPVLFNVVSYGIRKLIILTAGCFSFYGFACDRPANEVGEVKFDTLHIDEPVTIPIEREEIIKHYDAREI
ncbi:MAG: hypothetical protein H0X62_06015 [Bacteroidetes bacterium]|nr:hypothetical protein [Bacteroidota bacterium]